MCAVTRNGANDNVVALCYEEGWSTSIFISSGPGWSWDGWSWDGGSELSGTGECEGARDTMLAMGVGGIWRLGETGIADLLDLGERFM